MRLIAHNDDKFRVPHTMLLSYSSLIVLHSFYPIYGLQFTAELKCVTISLHYNFGFWNTE